MNDLKWSVVLCFVSTSSTVCMHIRSYCREQNVKYSYHLYICMYLCHLSLNGVLFVAITVFSSYCLDNWI